ncbi:Imm52 family immunity protein [Enterobacter ludwigii]|uniref:Imm52 family immunity protein n=1 Tax=Enterobacter ludwigii TaxID=299767 RepID=UPI001866B8BA|nr:Imm52 family immunity protein [Enterobacter ludwigii]
MSKIELTFFIKEKEITIDAIVNTIQKVADCHSCLHGSVNWYLTGESKEEAMKKKVIHDGKITKDAHSLITEDVKDDFPLTITHLWNEYNDVIRITNNIQADKTKFCYELTCNTNTEAEAMNFSSQVVLKIIDKIEPHIIHLETNDYSLHESMVFPDRLPVGWMFYIDKNYDEKVLNLPKQMHSIKRDGQPVGTLFVTKRDFFDGSNKADITLSNDLEIALVAHDILPTYKKIF